MSTNSALANLRRLFEGIATGDLAVIPDVVTDDFVDHGSPVPLPPGPAGYTQIMTFVTQVLDISYEIQDMICTEDRIVIRAVAHGIAVAAVHGADVAGQPYRMDTLHVYRTEGNRLAEHWGVRDEFSVWVQLGLIPAPQISVSDAA